MSHLSPTFADYVGLVVDYHRLSEGGTKASLETDALQDRMDGPWYFEELNGEASKYPYLRDVHVAINQKVMLVWNEKCEPNT